MKSVSEMTSDKATAEIIDVILNWISSGYDSTAEKVIAHIHDSRDKMKLGRLVISCTLRAHHQLPEINKNFFIEFKKKFNVSVSPMFHLGNKKVNVTVTICGRDFGSFFGGSTVIRRKNNIMDETEVLLKKKSEKDRSGESEKDNMGTVELTSVSLNISPRPSSAVAQTPPSTSNGREFRCACHECTPTKRVYFMMPTDTSTETHYTDLAETKKRSADQEPDQLLKMIMYIESAVYFALSSISSPDQYNIIKKAFKPLEDATNIFVTEDLLTPLMQHLAHRTRSLSLRVQSVLAYTMYQSNVENVWKFHHVVDEHKNYRPVRLPVGDEPNADSAAVQKVSIPEELYRSLTQEMEFASQLMYAHQLWGDSAFISGRSDIDMNFFNCLESVCGHLCVNTPVKKMAIFVTTGITWLRMEYKLEKQRPQPPGESKRLSSGSSSSQQS